MTAKKLYELKVDCEKMYKNIVTAIRMMPPDGKNRLCFSEKQANDLAHLLDNIATYLDWKLDTTEVKKDVCNKRKSKRKRK